MLRLATGVTPNYLPRASAFLESLRKCNIPTALFTVNFDRDPPNLWHIPERILVDYSKATVQLPKYMLQHGGFVQFAPLHWQDSDVIVFTDADAVLQRPFNEEELGTMESVAEGEFLVGYNRPNEIQTLDQEALCLQPTLSIGSIRSYFPGVEKMECRNFGFVVARMSAWKELFRRTVSLNDNCARCFQNPARVQFMAMYAIQQGAGLSLGPLSPVLHAHGHIGLKHGLTKEDGLWKQDGRVVAFAHAL